MAKPKLTRTQLKWIVSALNHNIADIREEMDQADDHSPRYALGEIALDGRKHLVTLLTDIINSDAKIIGID